MEETIEIIRPKLLLADDSITVRKVVELTFAEEGVEVFAVADGESAMMKFVEVQPDIVLVDVNMPDPDGYKICEMIKQDESTKEIPVLLLVGSFEPFDQTEAERVGADGFLIKPFQSVRDLVGKVSELLGNENGIPVPPADTEDIESLYAVSVSETYRGAQATTDAFLGDAGMDDDLIEASYREDAPDPEHIAADDDLNLEETVQGYDWMAEPAIEPEPPAANGDLEHSAPVEETAAVAETEAANEPEDFAPFNGGSVEPVREMAWVNEPETIVEPQHSAINDNFQPAAPPIDEAAALAEREPELELVAIDTEASEYPSDAPMPFGSMVDEFQDTVEVEEPQADISPAVEEPMPALPAEAAGYEPSEEFINIIARRVVEKLSDKAIRDIAREAVPRITEKLIRERCSTRIEKVKDLFQ